MKILHVIPSVSPKSGGPSFAVRAMAQAVASSDVEVHIATTDDDGDAHLNVPLEQPLVENGITYHYFRRQTRLYTFSWPLTRWLAQHVHKYDVVHTHYLFTYSTVPATRCAAWHKVPYIVRPLGTLNHWGMQNRRPFLKQLYLNQIERPMLKRASTLHFTSEQERLEAKDAGVDGPSVILPLGIDVESFQTLPPAEYFLARYPQLKGKQVLLFLSRIDPKKGLDLLLNAFAQIKHVLPETMLVIAGAGESNYVSQLHTLASQLGISAGVIWAGHLSGKEKLAAFAAAEIFVLPSYSENFGIAVVEAMAAGLPVVITNQVGIHVEVKQAGAGLVVNCNWEELVTVLTPLLKDAELRQKIAQAGTRLVKEQYSQEVMRNKLLVLYQDVIDQHHLQVPRQHFQPS